MKLRVVAQWQTGNALVSPLDNLRVQGSSPAHAHTPTSPLVSRFPSAVKQGNFAQIWIPSSRGGDEGGGAREEV